MSPLIAPSTTSGALSPSTRRPARKVVVFQWPCGTKSTRRSPRGARPRVRVMLVFAHVSSRKTSFSGFSSGIRARQKDRSCATSGRFCSAAKMTFFKTDLQIPQSVPDRCHADLDGKLLPQLFERGIGSLTHQNSELLEVLPKLGLGPRLPVQGLDAPDLLPLFEKLVDPALAHPILHGQVRGPCALVVVRQHPFSQIDRKGFWHGFPLSSPAMSIGLTARFSEWDS